MKIFFQNYLENRCSEDDFLSFLNWFIKPDNQKELEQNMEENWNNISFSEVEDNDLKDTLYKIHYEINKQEKGTTPIRKIANYLTRIAAILLLPLMLAYFIQHKQNSESNGKQLVTTPLASKTNFELPDGSMVWLNAGSTLSFPTKFNDKNRLVKLTGEAYFDVQKSKKPFIVDASNLRVKVLGTAFNVMAYHNEIPEITLQRGQVEVISNANEKQTLQPGEQARIDTLNHSITVNRVEPYLYTSWTNNQLIFRNETLENVVKRLERWYNISVEIEDETLAHKRMTATIEYESISEVMELLEITLPIKFNYHKNERRLSIENNPMH